MIGNNIKKLRAQHQMTQKNLADKLFVSAQAVSRWENNEVEPSISTIVELAKIFDVSADEILGVGIKEETKGNIEEDLKEEIKEELKEEIKEEIKKETQKEDTEFHKEHRQILSLCHECNSPIYESSEIHRTGSEVICSKCHKSREKRMHDHMISSAIKRRYLSFVFGALASLISFIIVLSIWESLPSTNERALGIFISVSMFTFISCVILNNNFLGYMFIKICTWSIKAPMLIFTFDVDGCLWFICMKLLFAILGVIIGILMFFIALLLSCALSVLVYPYAIIMNIKRPENTFM